MSNLWSYLRDRQGSFVSKNSDRVSRLYFPLMNEAGLRSWVTPELKGDINGGFDRYLTPPLVTEELHRSLNARYVWIKTPDHPDWNLNGLSPVQQLHKWSPGGEESLIEARPGQFSLTRQHAAAGLQVTLDLMVPATPDQVELWKITVTNTGDDDQQFTPWMVLPLYGRHADNIRDHRQVTSMFQKCYRDSSGVRIKPTIVHDESGHRVNDTTYFARFFDERGENPDRIWTRMQDFIGEGGSLANPGALIRNESEPRLNAHDRHGVESIAAAAFPQKTLSPREQAIYVAVVGMTREDEVDDLVSRYGSPELFDQALKLTLDYWQGITRQIETETANPDFDEWINWLAFQLKARQIFGNSYLPDFGYGRGGRGWRDLWQDLLSIFLVDPESARDEIVNNLKGIRIDGSNATIIGNHPGEFKADRNNIARAWCDHGAWPLFALNFYIQQTGDFDVLFRKIPWWKDQFINRSKALDKHWSPAEGTWQLDQESHTYESTVFEHVLVQQLSAFYHVGEHNVLLLEGADWNDTLDMARDRGESVCFESFYAGNLKGIIEWLAAVNEGGRTTVSLLRESTLLLDRSPGQVPVNYENQAEKGARLKLYFDQVSQRVSGEMIDLEIGHLMADLRAKVSHMENKIRKKEWIVDGDEGYFNGHYDNLGRAMHGKYSDGWRMDLTSQVIPTIFGVADNEQIPKMYQSARKHLGTPGQPGLRLCTPYPELDLNIGRLTGFSYGFKEHGSKWMQQNIMFMYGLYHRGFSRLGEEILMEVFALTHEGDQGKTFPGIPSYYEPGDRGAYMYLTGSSTWLYLTIFTQLFGIRGKGGHLEIKPAIPGWLFNKNGEASIKFTFRSKEIRVRFMNKQRSEPDHYRIRSVTIDDKPYPAEAGSEKLFIPDQVLETFRQKPTLIVIDLG